jgi:ABC-type multidrug transport system ATPase subunit
MSVAMTRHGCQGHGSETAATAASHHSIILDSITKETTPAESDIGTLTLTSECVPVVSGSASKSEPFSTPVSLLSSPEPGPGPGLTQPVEFTKTSSASKLQLRVNTSHDSINIASTPDSKQQLQEINNATDNPDNYHSSKTIATTVCDSPQTSVSFSVVDELAQVGQIEEQGCTSTRLRIEKGITVGKGQPTFYQFDKTDFTRAQSNRNIYHHSSSKDIQTPDSSKSGHFRSRQSGQRRRASLSSPSGASEAPDSPTSISVFGFMKRHNTPTAIAIVEGFSCSKLTRMITLVLTGIVWALGLPAAVVYLIATQRTWQGQLMAIGFVLTWYDFLALRVRHIPLFAQWRLKHAWLHPTEFSAHVSFTSYGLHPHLLAAASFAGYLHLNIVTEMSEGTGASVAKAWILMMLFILFCSFPNVPQGMSRALHAGVLYLFNCRATAAYLRFVFACLRPPGYGAQKFGDLKHDFHPYCRVMEERRRNFDEINFNTGDLIFFSGNYMFYPPHSPSSEGIKWGIGTFSHMGIVVRDEARFGPRAVCIDVHDHHPGLHVCPNLINPAKSTGLLVTELQNRLAMYSGQYFAVRRFRGTSASRAKLKHALMELLDTNKNLEFTNYKNLFSVAEFAMSIADFQITIPWYGTIDLFGNEIRPLKAGSFCAQWVAHVFQEAGLLPRDERSPPDSEYTPFDFHSAPHRAWATSGLEAQLFEDMQQFHGARYEQEWFFTKPPFDESIRTEQWLQVQDQVIQARLQEQRERAESNAEAPAPPRRKPGPTIVLKDLSYHYAGAQSPIVGPITARFVEKRLTAIVGPSGCGKTTILNAIAAKLANKDDQVLGTCRMFARNFYAEDEPEPVVSSAYVRQFVDPLPWLTPRELLKFRLQMSLEISRQYANGDDADKYIDELLTALSLSECADLRCGDAVHSSGDSSISGGQRRRAAVATDLVTLPQLLLVDEPTTGLDSVSALDMIKSIKRICSDFGSTAICTLHQPRKEIFEQLDDIMLLSEHGRVVYHGPASNAVLYFQGLGITCPRMMNPADFLLDIASARTDLLQTLPHVVDRNTLLDMHVPHKDLSVLQTLREESDTLSTPTSHHYDVTGIGNVPATHGSQESRASPITETYCHSEQFLLLDVIFQADRRHAHEAGISDTCSSTMSSVQEEMYHMSDHDHPGDGSFDSESEPDHAMHAQGGVTQQMYRVSDNAISNASLSSHVDDKRDVEFTSQQIAHALCDRFLESDAFKYDLANIELLLDGKNPVHPNPPELKTDDVETATAGHADEKIPLESPSRTPSYAVDDNGDLTLGTVHEPAEQVHNSHRPVSVPRLSSLVFYRPVSEQSIAQYPFCTVQSTLTAPSADTYQPFRTQLQLLLHRRGLEFSRYGHGAWVLVAVMACVGVLVGLIFSHKVDPTNVRSAFKTATYLAFSLAVPQSVVNQMGPTFQYLLQTYRYESERQSYWVLAYALSELFTLAIISVFCSIVWSIVTYLPQHESLDMNAGVFFIHIGGVAAFFMYELTLFLALQALTKSQSKATRFTAAFNIIMLTFNGFFSPVSEMSAAVRPLYYISPHQYAMTLLYLNQDDRQPIDYVNPIIEQRVVAGVAMLAHCLLVSLLFYIVLRRDSKAYQTMSFRRSCTGCLCKAQHPTDSNSDTQGTNMKPQPQIPVSAKSIRIPVLSPACYSSESGESAINSLIQLWRPFAKKYCSLFASVVQSISLSSVPDTMLSESPTLAAPPLQSKQSDCDSNLMMSAHAGTLFTILTPESSFMRSVNLDGKRGSTHQPHLDPVREKLRNLRLAAQRQSTEHVIYLANQEALLTLVDAEVFFPNGNQGYERFLGPITTTIYPKRLVALIGASGCGKTTLLDLIASQVRSFKLQGNVYVNGAPLSQKTRDAIAYVKQHDVLVDGMTVRQSLEFAAQTQMTFRSRMLENGTGNASQERERLVHHRVKKLLDMMELATQANVLVENLSGGEKRRLCVGTALVNLSPIVLLDEPTSGLDSAQTVVLISALRKLTTYGHTVIVTIHQPRWDSFMQFDDVILMARGRMVYKGDISQSVSFVRNLIGQTDADVSSPHSEITSPADYLLDTLSEKVVTSSSSGSEQRNCKQDRQHGPHRGLHQLVSEDTRRCLTEWVFDLSPDAYHSVIESEYTKILDLFVESFHRTVGSVCDTRIARMVHANVIRVATSDYDHTSSSCFSNSGSIRVRHHASGRRGSTSHSVFKPTPAAAARQEARQRMPYLAQVYWLLWRQLLVLRHFGGFVAIVATTAVSIIAALLAYGTETLDITATGIVGDQGAYVAGVFVYFWLVQLNRYPMFRTRSLLKLRDSVVHEQQRKAYSLEANTVASFIVNAMCCVLTAIAFALAQLSLFNSSATEMWFAALQLLLLATSEGLVMETLCNLSKRREQAFALYDIWTVLTHLSSGLWVANSDLPQWLSWLAYVSPTQYCFSAILMNEYGDNSTELDRVFTIEYSNKWQPCVGLGVAVAIFSLTVYASIVRRVNRSRGF